MKTLWMSLPLILLISASVAAQDKHQCKVIWMDMEALAKSMRSPDHTEPQPDSTKQLPEGYTILGTFKTKIAEEELTTKSFKIPNLSQFVTASVYYTDELMAVETPQGAILQDSVLVAIAVGDKEYSNATAAPQRAVAEVNINDMVNTFRISTRTQINNKSYVAYMECKW